MRMTMLLEWKANKEKDLQGYRIEWGPAQEIERAIVTVPKDVTKLALSVYLAQLNTFYVFAVRAFDKAGNQSQPTRIATAYASHE